MTPIHGPCPEGFRFWDNANQREMLLVDNDGSAYHGWLCYLGADGQWVTLRKATEDDLARIEEAKAARAGRSSWPIAQSANEGTVTCKGCDVTTTNTGTQLCDNCWEVHSRVGFTPAQIDRMRQCLELPLLFHGGGEWTDEMRERWSAITGDSDATTEVMCHSIRSCLESRQDPEESEG